MQLEPWIPLCVLLVGGLVLGSSGVSGCLILFFRCTLNPSVMSQVPDTDLWLHDIVVVKNDFVLSKCHTLLTEVLPLMQPSESLVKDSRHLNSEEYKMVTCQPLVTILVLHQCGKTASRLEKC